MKCLILFTAHGSTEEWEIAAAFMNSYPDDSILRNADILAYVNCPEIPASQIEKYLKKYPNKNKRLFYSPLNGHTVDESLGLLSSGNGLKFSNESHEFYHSQVKNILGWRAGTLEAYAITFPLVRQYDYVIHLNIDAYVTNTEYIDRLLVDNLNNDVSHHVFDWRNGNGFASDCQIYRPSKFKYNHFQDYKIGIDKYKDRSNKFVTEYILSWLIKKDSEIKYKIIPSNRRDFGIWHTHDNEKVLKFIKQKNTI